MGNPCWQGPSWKLLTSHVPRWRTLSTSHHYAAWQRTSALLLAKLLGTAGVINRGWSTDHRWDCKRCSSSKKAGSHTTCQEYSGGPIWALSTTTQKAATTASSTQLQCLQQRDLECPISNALSTHAGVLWAMQYSISTTFGIGLHPRYQANLWFQ